MILSVFYEHIADAAKQTGKTVSDICKLVSSYGISGVEIELTRLVDGELEIVEQLSDAGMGISCIYGFFDFGNHPDVQKGLELLNVAKRTGANKVLVIPGFIRDNEDKKVALDNMKQTLILLCKEAKNMGVTVGMEDFDDSLAPFATTAQLRWFMEQVPGLSCTFDTGNFLYSEEDATEALHQLETYVGHVHCKDRSLVEKEGEEAKLTIKGRKLYSSPVGYGCIPMKEIVTYMLRKGYRGTFAIEHFGSMNQIEDMKKSAEWLLQLEQTMEEIM